MSNSSYSYRDQTSNNRKRYRARLCKMNLHPSKVPTPISIKQFRVKRFTNRPRPAWWEWWTMEWKEKTFQIDRLQKWLCHREIRVDRKRSTVSSKPGMTRRLMTLLWILLSFLTNRWQTQRKIAGQTVVRYWILISKPSLASIKKSRQKLAPKSLSQINPENLKGLRRQDYLCLSGLSVLALLESQ